MERIYYCDEISKNLRSLRYLTNINFKNTKKQLLLIITYSISVIPFTLCKQNIKQNMQKE